MTNQFANSSWSNTSSGIWKLLAQDGSMLAMLRKDQGLWYERVFPNVKDHLPPKVRLQDAMKQAEQFMHNRESGI